MILNDPEEWRGKPVHVGEKVMMITDPNNTKLRIWIPEADNIPLDPNIPIDVILDPNPAETHKAKLIYVANASTVSENHVPSFVAEADWIQKPQDVKMGVKGTSILYGEHVSVFYLLLRRPWTISGRCSVFIPCHSPCPASALALPLPCPCPALALPLPCPCLPLPCPCPKRFFSKN